VTPDKSDWAEWDAAKAAALIGSLVLVGVTRQTPDGALIEQLQVYGIVVAVDEITGISIEAHGEQWKGRTFTLPPSPRTFEKARSGRYTLKKTGEVVVDPDYTTTWTVTVAPNS
jgi:hypothetical protein